MRIRSHAVLPRLEAYVKSICSMECEGGEDWNQVRVLPDTSVEIFLNYTATPTAVINQELYRRSIVCFRLSRPLDVQMRKGAGCMAVCFQPGMAYPFTHVPIGLFKDCTASFFDIWNRDASELEDELSSLSGDEERSLLVQHFLLARLEHGKEDLKVAHCLNRAQCTRGSITVHELVKETGLSQRHLSRRFHQSIGLSPKEYLGVYRFNASLQHLANYPSSSLTEIALLSGYYDQSHFIRDYKVYAGYAPGQVANLDHILF